LMIVSYCFLVSSNHFVRFEWSFFFVFEKNKKKAETEGGKAAQKKETITKGEKLMPLKALQAFFDVFRALIY